MHVYLNAWMPVLHLDLSVRALRLLLRVYVNRFCLRDTRQVGILGAERRAPSLVRYSPAVSSLFARFKQHTGPPEAKI
jgi:hypothetical protein